MQNMPCLAFLALDATWVEDHWEGVSEHWQLNYLQLYLVKR